MDGWGARPLHWRSVLFFLSLNCLLNCVFFCFFFHFIIIIIIIINFFSIEGISWFCNFVKNTFWEILQFFVRRLVTVRVPIRLCFDIIERFFLHWFNVTIRFQDVIQIYSVCKGKAIDYTCSPYLLQTRSQCVWKFSIFLNVWGFLRLFFLLLFFFFCPSWGNLHSHKLRFKMWLRSQRSWLFFLTWFETRRVTRQGLGHVGIFCVKNCSRVQQPKGGAGTQRKQRKPQTYWCTRLCFQHWNRVP